MSKFCGNCGAPSDDNAMVCGNCGAPFASAQQPVQQNFNPAPASAAINKNIPGVSGPATSKIDGYISFLNPVAEKISPKIGLATTLVTRIIAGVLAAIILILSVSIISGIATPSYKKVINAYGQAIQTGNGKKYVKMKYFSKDCDKEDIEDIKDDLLEMIDNNHDYYSRLLDSDKFKVKSEIKKVKKISKADMYDDYDIKKPGLRVIVKYRVSANGDFETFERVFLLVKSGGWKVLY